MNSPLTTLRDNLVVLLQDAEGNEILDAGLFVKQSHIYS